MFTARFAVFRGFSQPNSQKGQPRMVAAFFSSTPGRSLGKSRPATGVRRRKVNLWAPYWKRKKSRIPTLVARTRQHSLYERIRSSTGGYHQVRLLRLVNAARAVEGLPKIEQRAFTIWLNRFEKRRKETQSK
jgi:hypothetical protein